MTTAHTPREYEAQDQLPVPALTPLTPVFAEIEKHLGHALSLDPSTDSQAILDHVRVARGYLASARTIDGISTGIDKAMFASFHTRKEETL